MIPRSVPMTSEIIPARRAAIAATAAPLGRFSWRATLLILTAGFLLATSWPEHTLARSSAANMTTESISLFADARRTTPQTLFKLGETVWAVDTGVPLGGGFGAGPGQRRFQWVAPGGTIERQSEIKSDGQLDAYRIPPTAPVGTWTVKTVDPSNNGFAIATFVVRDPHPDKTAVNLVIGVFGPLQATAGKQLAYTLNVTNHGPDEAQNVHFVAEISNGAAFRSLAEARGWMCTKPAADDTSLITCTTTGLASGATATFTITYQVDDKAAGGATITHFADVISQTRELHEADNSASATTTVAATPCAVSCPGDITQARDPGKNGAVINYADPALPSDGCQPPSQPAQPDEPGQPNQVTCNPPSGSFFAAGITSVTCSNQAGGACSFKVTVTGAVAITLNGPDKLVLESHTNFADPGATAQSSHGRSFPATASGKVDVHTPGNYTITYTATDGVHTASATRTVEVVDTTPPRINCPADVIAKLPPNTPDKTMAVSYAPTATDNGARVSVAATPAAGALFSVGVTTVEATATDAANNQHACRFAVSVRYQFTGFFRPAGKATEMNAAQAGSEVPIRFSLSGDKGFNIFAPGYPVASEMACDGAEAAAEAPQPVATEQSNFSYDPNTDQYSYIWKTKATWAGSCRQLIIKLNDGSEQRAYFRFR